MSMVDELADARTYISDLRRQLEVRADENQRLEYELRKWHDCCDSYGLPHSPRALVTHHRANGGLVAGMEQMNKTQEAERDNWQGVAELAQRERDEALTGRKTADAVTVAAKELLTRRTTTLRERAERAEAENNALRLRIDRMSNGRCPKLEALAAQTKAKLRRMETLVSNYRAALELAGEALGLAESCAELDRRLYGEPTND